MSPSSGQEGHLGHPGWPCPKGQARVRTLTWTPRRGEAGVGTACGAHEPLPNRRDRAGRTLASSPPGGAHLVGALAGEDDHDGVRMEPDPVDGCHADSIASWVTACGESVWLRRGTSVPSLRLTVGQTVGQSDTAPPLGQAFDGKAQDLHRSLTATMQGDRWECSIRRCRPNIRRP